MRRAKRRRRRGGQTDETFRRTDHPGAFAPPLLCEEGNVVSLRQFRYTAGSTSKLQNVHSGVGAVHNIDVSAIIHLDIVRLDSDLAALIGAVADAALIGFVGNGGNVVPNFLGLQGITYVKSAHAGIEMGDEENASVVNRCHVFVLRVRAEAAAAAAEVAARFRNRPR